jgi:hypothetical protein
MRGPLSGSGLHAAYHLLAFGTSYPRYVDLHDAYLSRIALFKDMFKDSLHGNIPKLLQQFMDLLFIRIQFGRVNLPEFSGIYPLCPPAFILGEYPDHPLTATMIFPAQTSDGPTLVTMINHTVFKGFIFHKISRYCE